MNQDVVGCRTDVGWMPYDDALCRATEKIIVVAILLQYNYCSTIVRVLLDEIVLSILLSLAIVLQYIYLAKFNCLARTITLTRIAIYCVQYNSHSTLILYQAPVAEGKYPAMILTYN